MTAYVVVHSTVVDAPKFQEYAAAAGPTLAAFGGEMLARGPSELLFGTHAFAATAVIRFADRAAARAWYESPAYQALIPTRSAGMNCVFVLAGE